MISDKWAGGLLWFRVVLGIVCVAIGVADDFRWVAAVYGVVVGLDAAAEMGVRRNWKSAVMNAPSAMAGVAILHRGAADSIEGAGRDELVHELRRLADACDEASR